MASRQGIASGMIPSSTVWNDGQLLSRNFKSRLIFVVGTYMKLSRTTISVVSKLQVYKQADFGKHVDHQVLEEY